MCHACGVPMLRTARDRDHAEVQGEVLATARAHLAQHGPGGLSLRAVARDLGLVPSAVYRYFEDRDALLTALIIDAYNALGDAAEEGLVRTSRRAPARRWIAVAERVRAWAIAKPQEYTLLFGSPVPGYAAPVDTVGPGTRVSRLLVRIVAEAHEDGLVADRAGSGSARPGLSESSRRDMERLATLAAPGMPGEVLFLTVLASTQLFGLLSFELFGQARGLVERSDVFFAEAAAEMANRIGLV